MKSADLTDNKNSHTTLDELAQRIRAGDVDAFEQLFRSLHATLLQFAATYTRDNGRGEEIVQDVFFSVWQNRDDWSPRTSVRGYFFGAVRNRALNLRRRDSLEEDWATDEAFNDTQREQNPSLAADNEVERAELLRLAHAALDSLPERCRLAMHLRWREGMSYAEIAEVLGIGVKGVENQLARGLRSIRKKLIGD